MRHDAGSAHDGHVAAALAWVLGDTFRLRVHGFHWNVAGPRLRAPGDPPENAGVPGAQAVVPAAMEGDLVVARSAKEAFIVKTAWMLRAGLAEQVSAA
jgi:DNA-binding ferritin-like protein